MNPSVSGLSFLTQQRFISYIMCTRELSQFSHIWLFASPWTVTHQAPLSKGFFRQEYWSGLPFPPPGDLPNPGNEPASLSSPARQILYHLATWETHRSSYGYLFAETNKFIYEIKTDSQTQKTNL